MKVLIPIINDSDNSSTDCRFLEVEKFKGQAKVYLTLENPKRQVSVDITELYAALRAFP